MNDFFQKTPLDLSECLEVVLILSFGLESGAFSPKFRLFIGM